MKYKTIQYQDINDYFLNEKRFVSDSFANKLAENIFTEANPQAILELVASISKNSDPIPDQLPQYLNEYFSQTFDTADWITKRQLNLSSQLFAENAQHILMCLMMLSLPYCYAASVDAGVLLLSQRVKNDTRKRLSETGQFVFDVMADDAFEPTGSGIRSIQKVRLMHAVVRYHLKKNHQWDISKGLPINQEAMAGTNLAFSLMILRGLQRLNITTSSDQEQAYLNRWNLIGHIMGITEDLLFEDIKQIIALEERIRRRHFKKSDAGVQLTQALLDTAKDFFPDKSPSDFLYPIMNHLLGRDVCDILAIPYSVNKTEIVALLKMKNAFEQVFNIQSGRVNMAMKSQIVSETGNKKADFQSPLSL
ncbi:MAG: oxygenase MpaB family protein [Cytophagales bacterium]